MARTAGWHAGWAVLAGETTKGFALRSAPA
jgi:hypothetical protein